MRKIVLFSVLVAATTLGCQNSADSVPAASVDSAAHAASDTLRTSTDTTSRVPKAADTAL